MPKRGISMDWTLSDRIGELAYEQDVKWNRMAVTLIEVGIPLFEKLIHQSPTMAQELLKKRRSTSKRTTEALERVAERASANLKLDDRLALAIPSRIKVELRTRKKRTGLSMSQQVRQKLEIP
jgi:hypothetical protein